MNIRRRKGLEKEISKIISSAIILDVKNEKISKCVSISKVSLSNDARYADVYISLLLNSEEINKEEILNQINKIKGFFRKKISDELEIRHIPELRFYYDDSMEYSVKIAKLLNNLTKKED